MDKVVIFNLIKKVQELEDRIKVLESKELIQPHTTDEIDFSIIDSEVINASMPYDSEYVCDNCGSHNVNIIKVTPSSASDLVYNTITLYCHDCLKETEIEML